MAILIYDYSDPITTADVARVSKENPELGSVMGLVSMGIGGLGQIVGGIGKAKDRKAQLKLAASQERIAAMQLQAAQSGQAAAGQMPGWVIPTVAAGGVGLVLVAVMAKRGRKK